MKKIIGLLLLCASFIFASMNLQTATKEELMSIKGIRFEWNKISRYISLAGIVLLFLCWLLQVK